MTSEGLLKQVGIERLLKTSEGRTYVGELQKKYWKEILQPGDKRFDYYWGNKREKQKKEQEKQERIAKKMWEERNEAKRPKKMKLFFSLPEKEETNYCPRCKGKNFKVSGKIEKKTVFYESSCRDCGYWRLSK